MSDVFWIETVRLAISGAIVAAVAVPIGYLAREILRSRNMSLILKAQPWRVPWSGFELIFAFFLVAIIPNLLQELNVISLATGVLALPIQLAILLVAGRSLYPAWYSSTLRSVRPTSMNSAMATLARTAAVAVAVWLVLTPLVLGLNAAVTQLFAALKWQTESHPLTQITVRPGWERVLFLAQACIAAPLIEEILFRGMLLTWVIGARERNTGGLELRPVAPVISRPLIVMAVAALYASGSGKLGPLIFAGVLTLGLVVLWITVRRHQRHVRGIYASAALFALVHSAVWPSPIPLFVLGLGLGWLAVRTRGVLAPTIVHGLFNAVSAFYVLRGNAA